MKQFLLRLKETFSRKKYNIRVTHEIENKREIQNRFALQTAALYHKNSQLKI